MFLLTTQSKSHFRHTNDPNWLIGQIKSKLSRIKHKILTQFTFQSFNLLSRPIAMTRKQDKTCELTVDLQISICESVIRFLLSGHQGNPRVNQPGLLVSDVQEKVVSSGCISNPDRRSKDIGWRMARTLLFELIGLGVIINGKQDRVICCCYASKFFLRSI